MGRKRALIIGAGIAGLSAGCYLQMNGYDTEIFEMSQLPGGLCTAWERKGFKFDGCIHLLVGSAPWNQYYKLWEELNIAGNTKFVSFDVYACTAYDEGKVFKVFTDLSALEREMLELAPEDAKEIKNMMTTARKLSKSKIPVDTPFELLSFFGYAKFFIQGLELIKVMGQYGKMTVNEYRNRFKNETLRKYFPLFFRIDEEFAMAYLFMKLSFLSTKSAGYPIGGSLEFAKRIEKKYLSLGGKISYNSKVEKIIVKENKAAGIALAHGEQYFSDFVISAADGHSTIFDLLEGKYLDKEIVEDYNTMDLFQPLIAVSLGVAWDLSDKPHSINFKTGRLIKVDDKNEIHRFTARIFNFDPTMAPKGKSVVQVLLKADYACWHQLRSRDYEAYCSEKKRLADEIIEALENYMGNIAGNVEVIDVATPMTYIRYTNNWKGSYEGWLPTPRTVGKRIKKVLPGLENFYMTGQWVEAVGGISAAAISSRNLVQIICKKDSVKFTAR